MQVFYQKEQVRFAFGRGPIIYDRVIPLELKKRERISVSVLKLF
jgi:hypothetical protein